MLECPKRFVYVIASPDVTSGAPRPVRNPDTKVIT